MAYCSQQDLVDRFGETELIDLTDEANLDVIDATKVTLAINDAGATINGYLAGRYQLPLANVPEVLNRLAADIARYFLHDNGATEQVQKRYDDAIAYLLSVSKGAVALGLSDTGSKAVVNESAEITSAGSVFSRKDSSFI